MKSFMPHNGEQYNWEVLDNWHLKSEDIENV